MLLLQYIARIYSLDTLDARLLTTTTTTTSTSTSTPDKATTTPPPIDPTKPSSKESAALAPRAGVADGDSSPSLWATPEFFLYYLVVGVSLTLMVKTVCDVSKASHPNYAKYERLLSPGWIPGRKVDNSDAQYAGFRDNIAYMLLLIVVHPILRRLYDSVCSTGRSSSPSSAAASSSDARCGRRMSFDVYFALVFLVALHGFSALKVLLILYINYVLAKALPRAYIPTMTWLFNVGLLFANELCHGYPYSTIARLLLPRSYSDQTGGKDWASVLDSYGGLIPRWEILFNITILRLISFNMDYYWSLGSERSGSIEKKRLDPANLSDRDRVSLPAPPGSYSWRNYVAYTLYSPLYLAGPVLTFNEYISQCRYPPTSIGTRRTLFYGIRFLVCLLTMEVMLHFIYVVAIAKGSPAWDSYSPFEMSMLGYFNLHIVWLKLLLPWRFFRLWALLDGIDAPENMIRCMTDNYSPMAFWRGWHRSFNRWIVRYIYIPLGGSGGPGERGNRGRARAMANYLAVFTFVALWHDIDLRLLMWGWLVVLFILPEVLAGLAFPKRRLEKQRPTLYRMLCALGAVGNMLMMAAANMVGFAFGLEGLKGLLRALFGSYSGLAFLGAACTAIFAAIQLLFEHRQEERRQGFRVKF